MKAFTVVMLVCLMASSLHAAPTRTASTDLDKIVCKRYPVTGSLAKTKRICKTNREWMLSQEAAREDNEAMTKNICSGAGTCAGN